MRRWKRTFARTAQAARDVLRRKRMLQIAAKLISRQTAPVSTAAAPAPAQKSAAAKPTTTNEGSLHGLAELVSSLPPPVRRPQRPRQPQIQATHKRNRQPSTADKDRAESLSTTSLPPSQRTGRCSRSDHHVETCNDPVRGCLHFLVQQFSADSRLFQHCREAPAEQHLLRHLHASSKVRPRPPRHHSPSSMTPLQRQHNALHRQLRAKDEENPTVKGFQQFLKDMKLKLTRSVDQYGLLVRCIEQELWKSWSGKT